MQKVEEPTTKRPIPVPGGQCSLWRNGHLTANPLLRKNSGWLGHTFSEKPENHCEPHTSKGVHWDLTYASGFQAFGKSSVCDQVPALGEHAFGEVREIMNREIMILVIMNQKVLRTNHPLTVPIYYSFFAKWSSCLCLNPPVSREHIPPWAAILLLGSSGSFLTLCQYLSFLRPYPVKSSTLFLGGYTPYL